MPLSLRARSLLPWAFALALFANRAQPVRAQQSSAVSPTAEPSLEAKERARTAYARGQAAFAQGDYATAKVAFELAFTNVPNPIVLLSVAECASKLGLNAEALATYDRYLQLNPAAADRAEIEHRRDALRAPARLALSSEPAGADIVIDHQWTGQKTPAELSVPAGAHTVQLIANGYDTGTSTLMLAPAQRVEHQLALVKQPGALPPPAAVLTPAPAEPPALPVPPPPAELPTTALWLSGGIGAAGLIAGTVLGVLAVKEHSDFNAHPTEATADRGERLALFSDVGFGVGAMAAVTAVVLYMTNDTPPADSQTPANAPAAQGGEKSAARLQLIPRLSRHGASATAQFRF